MIWNKKELNEKLNKYRQNINILHTYTGFLAEANISKFDLEQLKQDCLLGVSESIECAKLLDLYKLKLEAYLEEQLIYQQEGKRKDYKVLQAIYLESKNSGLFRDNAKHTSKHDMRIGTVAKDEPIKLGRNESGIKLDTTNHS